MSEHPNCPFCVKPDAVIENELAFARYDGYPVSASHCLIMPRRHVAEYFQATAEEKTAIWSLVDEMKVIIDQECQPDGYNVGINIGESAGQSVPHIHVHIIPRCEGDMENPRGGVRGVIPGRQKYEKKIILFKESIIFDQLHVAINEAPRLRSQDNCRRHTKST